MRAPARRKLVVVCASDIQPEPIQWLWPGRIALGKLTLVAGDPGLGKSMLTSKMAAHVTRGLPWPVDGAACPRGRVLIVSAEDGKADTIRPRLDAAGADTDLVHILHAVREEDHSHGMLCLQRDVGLIDDYLDEHPDVRMVTIDPVSSFLGAADSHKNSDVRAVLHPLTELAERRRVAIVAVSHLNKGAGGGSALYRVSGSLAFVAAARASFLVTKDRHNPERRLILPSKNNLGPDTTGIAYRIVKADDSVAMVEWEPDAVTVSADQALAPEQPGDHARRDIADWLRELLAEGRLPARQVQAEAESVGTPWRKVQRAMKAAGVESVREGFGRDAAYYWRVR